MLHLKKLFEFYSHNLCTLLSNLRTDDNHSKQQQKQTKNATFFSNSLDNAKQSYILCHLNTSPYSHCISIMKY